MAMSKKQFLKHGYDFTTNKVGYSRLARLDYSLQCENHRRKREGRRVIGRAELKKRLMRDLNLKRRYEAHENAD